jgi:poly-gamma-glutamate synthesis protein (capsule biosynthesis protein)
MKITYQKSASSAKKNPPLSGIRKVTDIIKHENTRVKANEKAQKPKFDLKRVLLLSILGFCILTLAGYLANVQTIVWGIEFLKDPTFKVSQATYKTYSLTIDSALPDTVQEKITTELLSIDFNGTKRFTTESGHDTVSLIYTSEKKEDDTVLQTDYLVPVGHLYWVRDTIAKSNYLQDGMFVQESKANTYKDVLAAHFGKEPTLKLTKDLAGSLKSQEKIGGFISFSDLSAQYKILQYDNKFFLDEPDKAAIAFYLVLRSDSNSPKNILKDRLTEVIPPSFDAKQALSVRMTGVTAITRGLGIKTNASGDTAYAARKIGSFLAKADLTHVSNEISFLNNCAYTGGVSFCTRTEHIEALKKSGVDIVELTGNHNNDKGAAANTTSINTYKKLGWDYFGGGLNSIDASKILYKDVKGTKIAFIGYNYYDSVYGTGAIAGATRAGANSWSNKKVSADIAEAKKNADVVIVTFQYQECWSYTDNGSTVESCYAPIASPNQQADFRYAVDAGADIVIGTQAHQPQTYEIYKGKNIFYGLGNLYFDQTQQLGTRQGLILTHYFYAGKYISTTITTTIYDNDLLTYVTSGNQRTQLLNSLKKARN